MLAADYMGISGGDQTVVRASLKLLQCAMTGSPVCFGRFMIQMSGGIAANM